MTATLTATEVTITYSASEVVLLMKFANMIDGNSFAQQIGLWTQSQVETWIDSLADQENPYIAPVVYRFFHLEPCEGGFQWTSR